MKLQGTILCDTIHLKQGRVLGFYFKYIGKRLGRNMPAHKTWVSCI